jgi:biopolymer transport protein ExbD/biopolymer transport protein TolR
VVNLEDWAGKPGTQQIPAVSNRGMAIQTNPGAPQINVTPLIDILLVLLIIFLVITPQNTVGLNAQLPEPAPPDAAAPPDPRLIVLSIDPAERLTLNTQIVERSELALRLRDLFAQRAARTLFIEGAPGLEYASVARVIDIARGAQVDRVALLTRNVDPQK